MTIDTGWQWLAYATREPKIRELVQIDDQVVVKIGELLERSPLMNPNLVKPTPKKIKFVCMCGCGELVETTYVTTPPKYKKGHQTRHASKLYYHRQKAKREAAEREAARREKVLKG